MGIKINNFIFWCRYTPRLQDVGSSGILIAVAQDTLSSYHEGGTVTFGDDSKGNIIGIGNSKIDSSPLIENVVLVDALKHNLLSISQLCDRGFKVIFDNSSCNILDCKTDACILLDFVKIMYILLISQVMCLEQLLSRYHRSLRFRVLVYTYIK